MSVWVSEDQLHMLMKQLDGQHTESPQEISASERQPKAYLQVKDGEISFIPSEDEQASEWPLIEATPPLRLILNGKAVDGPHRVKPEDRVDWHAEQKRFRLDVSPDKMKLRLLLLPDGRCALKPADQDKTDKLILKASEDVCHPISPPVLQTVIDAVQALGVVHYDIAAIMAELQLPTFVPVMIGGGREPVTGSDARLEIFFNEQIESSYEEIDGVVDYRNHLKIPSVRKDDLIARKIPMKESSPGYDVFGNKVEAPRLKDFVMIARPHVRLVDNEAYAEKDGRPRVTGDKIKMIDITTSYVIPGDVDMKTGNVVFTGDIHIYGNVNDGMIVEALGDVYVSGNVYRATITATGSIYIKGNTVGSKLYSGHFGVLFNRLFTHSTKLNERLTLYRQVSAQLQQLAAGRGQAVSDRQVHQLLMESKFRDIPVLCRAILGCISSIQSIQKNLMADLKSRLEKMMKPAFLQQGEVMPFIMDLQRKLIETIEKIRNSEETGIRTDIQQCHLSEIMSNGDILIRRQGVLQSKLYSKGNIVFFETDSVCRGSELEAGHTISAMIVGGVSGGSTNLKAGHKVAASLMYEGKVTVGKFSREILEPVEHVIFRIRDNQLLMETAYMEAGNQRRTTG